MAKTSRDRAGLPLAAAAVLGLGVAPLPGPAGAAMIATPLCGGGTIYLPSHDRRLPADGPGACHAACAVRRDDDDCSAGGIRP